MNPNETHSKKQYCARCFLPIDFDDKVEVDGHNFHRNCSMCCICRTFPSSAKMFHGHVFCKDCFNAYVLTQFKGENSRTHSNSWWMQWAPGTKPQNENNETKECKHELSGEPPKRCICARCLQIIDQNNKVDVDGQTFHSQCAKCYFCRTTPKSNIKIYYGQVFCEDCFHRHVLNQNKDNPPEFFRHCFDQWQNNAQFAENMRDFMGGSRDNTPFVFMMQGSQPPFCRCGTGPQDWSQNNEAKKSATLISIGEESQVTWDLSFENRTEVSDIPESCNAVEESLKELGAAEKIEKLTKYVHRNWEKPMKKLENFHDSMDFFDPSLYGWKDLQKQKNKKLDCPKCLWQCGFISVRDEYLIKKVCCSEDSC